MDKETRDYLVNDLCHQLTTEENNVYFYREDVRELSSKVKVALESNITNNEQFDAFKAHCVKGVKDVIVGGVCVSAEEIVNIAWGRDRIAMNENFYNWADTQDFGTNPIAEEKLEKAKKNLANATMRVAEINEELQELSNMQF